MYTQKNPNSYSTAYATHCVKFYPDQFTTRKLDNSFIVSPYSFACEPLSFMRLRLFQVILTIIASIEPGTVWYTVKPQ